MGHVPLKMCLFDENLPAAAAAAAGEEDREPCLLAPSYLDFLGATKRDKCAAVAPALLCCGQIQIVLCFSPRCCMVCGNARLYRGKQRQQKWIVSSCCMGARHRVKSTSLLLEEDRNRKEPQQALGTLFFCLSCRRRFESSPNSQTADAMLTPNTAAVVWAETS